MTVDVRVPRMALLILRDSLLGDGCKHPAEALEHDWMRGMFRCSVCGTETSEECVAMVAADPSAFRWTERPGRDSDGLRRHSVAAGTRPLW